MKKNNVEHVLNILDGSVELKRESVGRKWEHWVLRATVDVPWDKGFEVETDYPGNRPKVHFDYDGGKIVICLKRLKSDEP